MTYPVTIGGNLASTALIFSGYVDEVFITKQCLHTATFTPPTAPYVVDDNTLALLNFD